MRYILAPELAPPRDGARAYLQRAVAIVLAVTCAGLSFDNYYNDCRIIEYHKYFDDSRPMDSALADFTRFASTILSAFGVEDRGSKDKLDVDDIEDQFALENIDFEADDADGYYFGHHGFAPLYFDNSRDFVKQEHRCFDYKLVYEYLTGITEGDQKYESAIEAVAITAPSMAILGIIFASVETCFTIFYPSVIVGSIFLALAGIFQSTWLLMFMLDYRKCLSENRCFVGPSFWLDIFTLCGYFTASCFLIFGPRTYPWLLRKSRDPDNCKVIDPEILSEKEIQKPEEKWRTIVDPGELAEAIREFELERGISQTDLITSGEMTGNLIPLEAYLTLKHELNGANQKLVQYEEECLQALARAEKAEAKLREYTNRYSIDSVSVQEQNNRGNEIELMGEEKKDESSKSIKVEDEQIANNEETNHSINTTEQHNC